MNRETSKRQLLLNLTKNSQAFSGRLTIGSGSTPPTAVQSPTPVPPSDWRCPSAGRLQSIGMNGFLFWWVGGEPGGGLPFC
jgi:hypothetical protein